MLGQGHNFWSTVSGDYIPTINYKAQFIQVDGIIQSDMYVPIFQ